MSTLIKMILAVLLITSVVMMEAEAKRFGGGRSFGMSRSVGASSAMSSMKPASALASQASSAGKKWLGPLMGFAAGALIGSLLFGNGFAGGMMMWLAIGLGIFLLFSWWRSRSAAAPAMTSNQPYQFSPFSSQRETEAPTQHFSEPQATASSQATPSMAAAMQYPAGFNTTDFLRDVKVQFIRLQAAYDAKNLNDIREFTTPEMFAEIQMQLQERGDAENHTEVVSIENNLLDVQNEFQQWISSVRFHGEIREERNAPTVKIDEIWHFKKDVISGKWFVAGIQQQN